MAWLAAGRDTTTMPLKAMHMAFHSPREQRIGARQFLKDLFTPFCAAASSMPTPSCLSEHYLYFSVTWRKRHTSAATLRRIMSRYADGGRAKLFSVFFFFDKLLNFPNFSIKKGTKIQF